MPGVYKEKTCPACGIKHRKRGEFCSKTCSNKGRSPEVYEKVSEWMKTSDKGQELIYNLNNDPDYEPPLVGGRNDANRPNGFISGGDLWVTDNGDW